MEEEKICNKLLVLVPCPLQGHMTPMLQLASILHFKGFSIVVAHTKLNSPDPSSYKGFILLPMGENLLDEDTSNIDPLSLISIINSNCAAPFEESLAYFIGQNPQYQVSCIIHDTLMSFAEDVASHLELPSIILRTSSSTSFLAYRTVLQLHQDGCFPLQDSLILKPVPQLYSIRFKELGLASRSYGDVKKSYGDFTKILQLIRIACRVTKSSAVIWNSMEHLEHHSLAQFQNQHQVPSFAVGPFHKIAPTISTSLLSEDTECMRWLDSQAKNSVIYVSLGSLATMETSELAEMAWGLANSEQPFLWVVRPGSVIGSEWIEHLPESFKETIGNRGCIVEWAPQKEVLAHDSVGGFWSHCGWNSTLESICEGIPIICKPAFGDQWVNARYLNHVWKIGLELEGVLDRQNIEKAVRRLMQEMEGEQMRQRAAALKEMAQLAIVQGGASYNSLNSLMELIHSF